MTRRIEDEHAWIRVEVVRQDASQRGPGATPVLAVLPIAKPLGARDFLR